MTQQLLIVEDDGALREHLKALLLAEGYQVRTAANGQDALHALAQEPVQLVVTDLGLPVLDGYQLIDRLRSLPGLAAPRILVYSGEADLQQRLAVSLEQGAIADALTKPADLEVLLATVRRLLPSVETDCSPCEDADAWDGRPQSPQALRHPTTARRGASWTHGRLPVLRWEPADGTRESDSH
jgi:DNA-binding response OmpR family regulator